MNCLRFLLGFLIIFSSVCYAQDSAPFVVENSVVHKMESQMVSGQIYEIRVSLPASYSNSPDKTYPILFVLDGQWNFTLAKDVSENLAYDGMMPEAIVAAITWGGEGDNPSQLRVRDFLRPELVWAPLSGGAEMFLEALTQELVPYVQTRYRSNGHRVLMGGSLAGLFTTYAMLEKPGFFNGYLATAGSYAEDWNYLQEKLAALVNSSDLRDVRSYMAVGKLDTLLPVDSAMSDSIKAANLKGLRHKYQEFPGIGHSGVAPVTTAYGLQYLFKRPFVKLSEEFLQQYAGTFEGGPEGYPPIQTQVVVLGPGTLGVGHPGYETPYLAESPTRFYIKGIKSEIEFTDTDNFVVTNTDSVLNFTRVTSETP